MPAFRAPQDLPCLAFAFRIDEDVRRLLPCGDRFYFRARLLFPHRTVDEQRARGAMWTRARMVWFVFFLLESSNVTIVLQFYFETFEWRPFSYSFWNHNTKKASFFLHEYTV